MPTSRGGSTLHQQDRAELPEDILAMPQAQRPAMPVLHVDRTATPGGAGVQGIPTSSSPTTSTSGVITFVVAQDDPKGEVPESVPSHGYNAPGDKPMEDRREVPQLRQGLGQRAHRGGQEAGQGEGDQEEGEVHLPQPKEPELQSGQPDHGSSTSADSDGRSGNRRSVAALQPEREPVNDSPTAGNFTGNKRQKRILRQATKALEEMHCMWNDLITSLQPDEALNDPGFFEQHLCTIASGGADSTSEPKAIHRLANLLGESKRQARQVAEVFNPSRFGPRAPKFGLKQGEAFDLVLGDDIRQEGTRRTIRQYLQSEKPDLVISCLYFPSLHFHVHPPKFE